MEAGVEGKAAEKGCEKDGQGEKANGVAASRQIGEAEKVNIAFVS